MVAATLTNADAPRHATYSADLLRYHRRPTRVVMVGNVGVGGDHPIRVQSMTTTQTKDVEATTAQAVRLVEAGCEIVRITAPTVQDAKAIGEVRARLRALGITVPLVADIHFSPAAAMEAADHVEKVRINPGNFADSRRFAQRSYTDAEYDAELARVAERFSPLVLKCKERGVAMRIGTNHGSLSDRIVNRYGDTPEGMVESALEFVRICESHGYYDVILSMKASNPKVMVAAYRLLAARMEAVGMRYPFHLGVTEAGNGEDARIKSAVGIGTLLEDGIGDTIRVSLAEEPEAEIPVAMALAQRARPFVTGGRHRSPEAATWDPYHYDRRHASVAHVGQVAIGPGNPPAVFGQLAAPSLDEDATLRQIFRWSRKVGKRAPQPDVALLPVRSAEDVRALERIVARLAGTVGAGLPLVAQSDNPALIVQAGPAVSGGYLVLNEDGADTRIPEALRSGERVPLWLELAVRNDDPESVERLRLRVLSLLELFASAGRPVAGLALRAEDQSALLHAGRAVAMATEHAHGAPRPLIHLVAEPSAEDATLVSSVALGSLLCDGIGDSVQIVASTPDDDVRLAFSVLQGAGARLSRTDYVACPSCGRTLFDLQTTTDRIKSRTSHLQGVKLAIMGCVVNGPGEMADADFGYVGGSPGHVNLYVGKDVVERNVPEGEADERLIELIRSHGRWTEPEPDASDER